MEKDLQKRIAILVESHMRSPFRKKERPGFDLRNVPPEDRERVLSLRQQDYIFVVKHLLTHGLIDFIEVEHPIFKIVNTAQPEDLPVLRDAMWAMAGEDPRRKIDLISKLTSITGDGMCGGYTATKFPYRQQRIVGQDYFDYRATIYCEALTFLLFPQRKDNKSA